MGLSNNKNFDLCGSWFPFRDVPILGVPVLLVLFNEDF